MREANQSLAQASSEKLPAEAGESTGPTVRDYAGESRGLTVRDYAGRVQTLTARHYAGESPGLTVRHYAKSQHSALKRMSPSNPSCRVQETLQERRHKECKSRR